MAAVRGSAATMWAVTAEGDDRGSGMHVRSRRQRLAAAVAAAAVSATVGSGDLSDLAASAAPAPAALVWLLDDTARTPAATSAAEGVVPADAGQYRLDDGREVTADDIEAFLSGRDAPLAAYAEEFIAAGVAHEVDPRLVVAISIAESSGGKELPAGSHNAWGWSGAGPHGLHVWPSWPEAIDDFTGRLARLYDTDNVNRDFATTYCPPNADWWLDTVLWVIDQL